MTRRTEHKPVIVPLAQQTGATSPEQYPALSLADVYGAIAHYLRHRDDVDQYLKHQETVWQASRDEWNARSGALVQRLRDARNGVPSEPR